MLRRSGRLLWVLAGVLIPLCVVAPRPSRAAEQQAEKMAAKLVAHGKYLVDHVGLCGDCHTPRNASGVPDASKYLEGAPIEFRPVHDMPFAEQAPNITGEGLKKWSMAQLVEFLRGKTGPDGHSIPQRRRPMPAYRLNERDAKAVAAYLFSLHPHRAQ